MYPAETIPKSSSEISMPNGESVYSSVERIQDRVYSQSRLLQLVFISNLNNTLTL